MSEQPYLLTSLLEIVNKDKERICTYLNIDEVDSYFNINSEMNSEITDFEETVTFFEQQIKKIDIELSNANIEEIKCQELIKDLFSQLIKLNENLNLLKDKSEDIYLKEVEFRKNKNKKVEDLIRMKQSLTYLNIEELENVIEDFEYKLQIGINCDKDILKRLMTFKMQKDNLNKYLNKLEESIELDVIKELKQKYEEYREELNLIRVNNEIKIKIDNIKKKRQELLQIIHNLNEKKKELCKVKQENEEKLIKIKTNLEYEYNQQEKLIEQEIFSEQFVRFIEDYCLSSIQTNNEYKDFLLEYRK